MNLPFNFPRTLQAAAFLLKTSPARRLTYFRVLKLLYIAERELLAENAFVLTGDQPVAMKRGPLHHRVYQLVKEQGEEAATWSRFISRDGYEIFLKEDPGVGQLPLIAQKKLQTVAARYHEQEDPDLEDVVHEFPEWKQVFPTGSNATFPIRWEDVLAAQGKAELAEDIEAEEQDHAHFNDLFGKQWRERRDHLRSDQ